MLDKVGSMVLICRYCGTINQDPGGDPRQYRCGNCSQQQLERVATKPDKILVAGIAGATIGGLAGGPVGALAGAIIGLLAGDKLLK